MGELGIEKLAERSVFLCQIKNLRKGIGKFLFKALLEDMKKQEPYFENGIPLALVIYAFEVWGLIFNINFKSQRDI